MCPPTGNPILTVSITAVLLNHIQVGPYSMDSGVCLPSPRIKSLRSSTRLRGVVAPPLPLLNSTSLCEFIITVCFPFCSPCVFGLFPFRAETHGFVCQGRPCVLVSRDSSEQVGLRTIVLIYSPQQPVRPGVALIPTWKTREPRHREGRHLPPVPQLESSSVGNQVGLTPERLTSAILLTRIFLSLWICRPVILDPADPTWDVGNGAAWRWDLLAQEAESCYDRPCFLQAAGGAVQPWEVPVSEGLLGPLAFTPNLCAQCFLCWRPWGVEQS